MKRALALLAACSLFGFAGLAQFSGSWELTLTFSPSSWTPYEAGTGWSACAGTYEVFGLSSELTLSYVLGNMTFSSVSGFSTTGFDSQKFTAVGDLGPVSFDVTMKFIPSAVTKYDNEVSETVVEMVLGVEQTPSFAAKDWVCCHVGAVPVEYEPKFDDLTAKASVTFGGLTVEGLAFLERGNYDKTYVDFLSLSGTYPNGTWDWDETTELTTCTAYKNGLGTRLKISGELNGITVTSYTYFNLTERSLAAAKARAVALGGGYLTDLYLGKSDSGFQIVDATCAPGFTEEYLLLEGFSLCCGTSLDAALTITCDGFSKLEVLLNDVPFLCCGMSFDALFTFDLTSKSYTLKPKITADWACVTFDVGVDYSAGAISAFKLYGLSFVCELAECLKISSDTSFDTLLTNYHPIANPVTGGLKTWYIQPVVKCGDPDNDNYVAPVVDDGEIEDGYYLPYCIDQVKYHIWEKFSVESCLPGCCGGEVEFSATAYFGDKYELAGYGFAYYDAENDAWAYYWTDTVGNVPAKVSDTTFAEKYAAATGSTWSTSGVTKSSVTPVELYTAADNDNLFGWVKTDLDLTIPISSAIDITTEAVFSVFGFESVEVGFTFSF